MIPHPVLYSIIIPARNAEQSVARTISSCLAQTVEELEIIVVVNDSHDKTLEVVRSFDDPRIITLDSPLPGRSRARNQALDVATGDFVVFLDADDTLEENKLSNSSRYLDERQGRDAVQGATSYVQANGCVDEVAPYAGAAFFERLLVRNTIPINSMAVARKRCARFPESMEHCEDWAFWLATLDGLEVGVYPDADATVFRHELNTSSDVHLMRGYELIPRLDYWARPSTSVPDRARRCVLLLNSLASYAGMRSIVEVEDRLNSHSMAKWIEARLRRHPVARRMTQAILRRVLMSPE